MPAIQPARLRKQVQRLLETFDQPDIFVSLLHELLEFYADRTLRSSQVIEAAPLLNSYRVPKPVMRFIERDLAASIVAQPEAAFNLADALWNQRWLETRLLALTILGRLPTSNPDLISERVREWGSSCKEEKVLKALASDGVQRLRKEQREDFIRLLEDWYSSGELPQVLLGLRSTPDLLKDKKFDNLPLIFRWVGPLVRDVDLEFKEDLREVMRYLIRRSPQETAFFIRQALASAHDGKTARMLRPVVDEFPEEMKASLIQEIREFRKK
jgi:hypothetical protein